MMKRYHLEKGISVNVTRIEDYIKGWFVGNFSPVLIPSKDFEIAVKWFKAGEKEAIHKQIIATEVTVVIEGSIKLGDQIFIKGDVILIPPGEFAAFESLTDSALVCLKTPSIPDDKVLGREDGD